MYSKNVGYATFDTLSIDIPKATKKKSDIKEYVNIFGCAYLSLDRRKPVFGGLRTTQARTSLRIRAVWTAPLLFTYRKVSYLNLLQFKFQFSS